MIPGMGGRAGIAGACGITGAWRGSWCTPAAGGCACGVADGTVVAGVSVVAGGLVSVVAGGGGAGRAGETGVVLTPGAGAVADWSPERNAIAAALPTSSTAIAAVTIATAGRRYQRARAVLRAELGCVVCAGRAVVSVEPPSDFGFLPLARLACESSWVCDQASGGISPDVRPAGGACSVVVVPGRGHERDAGGAAAVAVTGATGADAVALVSPGPRAARNAPPVAAVSSGLGVVTTGTRRCRDSVVVTPGMCAPPPTETTATRSRIPLRAKVSSSTATKLVSDARIASSSSFLVSRRSPPIPGARVAIVLADSCSLAFRHTVRNLLSEPIAENDPVLALLAMTVVNSV